MPTPRKNFVCAECGKKTSSTVPNFYKQKKNLGYNRCSDCGAKSSAKSVKIKYQNTTTNKNLVEAKCPNCGVIRNIQHRQLKNNSLCPKCSVSRNHKNGVYSNSYKNRIGKKEFQSAVKNGMKQIPKDVLGKNAKLGASYWKDKKKKKIIMEKRQLDDYKNSMKEIWTRSGYREKMAKIASEKSKEVWDRPGYKEKMAQIRSSMPKVSSIQEQLYSTLSDLNIKHYREHMDSDDDPETIIGPYHFDCVIPVNNKKLLIECQGDYWHSLEKSKSKDKAKATYIEKYHKDCEIKYLWEHEFKCKDKIVELIKYWTGITEFNLVDFDFNVVEIRECPASDYKLLLSKYHYLPNAGRGGIAYGAYMNNELVAVCVFSPLGRQNLPFDKKSTRELSRLCIHPRYQKKNFASWFVSRCIKKLDSKYKTIISYCDTTFNHDGAVYKACNFKLDGEVKPDYWYVSEDGWVMHKKTLYNHAKKMSMKEKEFAESNGYKKVYGKDKLRFVFNRQPKIL